MVIKIGDTVWFHKYGTQIESGEVIGIHEKAFGTDKTACLKCRDGFESVAIDSRFMYTSRADCVLAMAQKKQQDAARLLTEAAELFKNAGGMRCEKSTE